LRETLADEFLDYFRPVSDRRYALTTQASWEDDGSLEKTHAGTGSGDSGSSRGISDERKRAGPDARVGGRRDEDAPLTDR
jgi:hypothetical protein